MEILHGAILGLVQGLCEFLPVSSSGHLVLLQTILGLEEGALFLDTMLHVGTLFAVFAVYRKKLMELLRNPFQRLTWLLCASTLATVAVALLAGDLIDEAFEGELLGLGFLLTTLVLTLNQRLSPRGGRELSYPKAIGVGLMQGIAILPGLSRSGSTISAARLMGLDKDAAAEYSFLLSIPAILGSLVLQLPEVVEQGIAGVSWGGILAGMAVAALSGYFAIRLMLRLIREKSLMPFAVYTGVLGALVLLDQHVFGVFF